MDKLVAEIMAEMEKDGTPVTEEEAREMALMELKGKENRHYEKTTTKKPTKRTPKINLDKANLISRFEVLTHTSDFSNVVVTNNGISFTFRDKDFTLNLIEHRPKK